MEQGGDGRSPGFQAFDGLSVDDDGDDDDDRFDTALFSALEHTRSARVFYMSDQLFIARF